MFEKASSMSAGLSKHSYELDREKERTEVHFESMLLKSNVYRRAYESFGSRKGSTALEGGNVLHGGGPPSIMSVSSNSAIASDGDSASSSGDSGLSGREPDNIKVSPIQGNFHSIASSHPPPTLELSASSSPERAGEPSTTNTTRSTLATTGQPPTTKTPRSTSATTGQPSSANLTRSTLATTGEPPTANMMESTLAMTGEQTGQPSTTNTTGSTLVTSISLVDAKTQTGLNCGRDKRPCKSSIGIQNDEKDSADRPSTDTSAVERVVRSLRAEIEKEVEFLEAFDRSQEHLIRLLASCHWHGHFHLLCPWVEVHLQDFWDSQPSLAAVQQAEDRSKLLCRTLGQRIGLAYALESLHSCPKLQDITWAEYGCQARRRGRHGDIKPGNIPWFDLDEDMTNQDGVQFEISDSGLAALHSLNTDRTGPETRGGTETHGGPEPKHDPPGHRLSSEYDIWSLAFLLIFTAFVCWLTGGRDEVEAFKRSRYARLPEALFSNRLGTLTHKLQI